VKELSHVWFTDRIRPRRKAMTKVERNSELAVALGVETEGTAARLPSDAAAEARVAAYVAGLPAQPLVALHPGVSAFGEIKRWAPERFAALAERLAESLGALCIVTYGPGEETLAREVAERSRGRAVVGPKTASLLELVALFRRTRLLIAADTGPLHLAAAVGVPVVGLYGPKDPRVYAPWSAEGAAAEVVWKGVHCSPCRRRTCPDVICMPAITVEDALAAALRVASAATSPRMRSPA
jgi:ADP-heptose:LPS heptosyltransferase